MRIARILGPSGASIGVVREGAIIDLASEALATGFSWAEPAFRDLRLFLMTGERIREVVARILATSSDDALPLSSVRILPPFELGGRIFAHVANYSGHDKEANVKLPARPYFFPKSASSVTAHRAPIVAHPLGQKLDHEVELAVVIGRCGVNISVEAAMEYVGGYTVANDISWRDRQFNEDTPDLRLNYGMNWLQGKGLDTACPLGPSLVLSDELVNPEGLRITCRVNGTLRQDASTSDMHWTVAQQIAEASKSTVLYPGDVILTGSPAGGGLKDGRYLQPGDLVTCEIEKVGTLENRVEARHQYRDGRELR